MKKVRSVHFVGIKGVGMAPLAIIAKEAGFKVSGCDIAEEFITDESLKKAGIEAQVGFSKDHIQNADLVITTGAHGGFDNQEVQAAKDMGVKILTQGEAVGVFMSGELFGRSDIKGISVTGSHGKTTTTALIATILKEGRKDPSYVIGTGTVPSLDSCGHYGKGTYFVVEADEYATEPTYDKTPKFLWQHPKILVFTNIELDHPDLYSSIDDVRNAFLQFANTIPRDGILIAYGDDRQIQKLLKEYIGTTITFGYSPNNDFILKKTHVSDRQTFFWVETKNANLGEFTINIPGEHNALNGLAATIVCVETGLTIDAVKKGLRQYSGSKRRFEYVGRLEGGAVLFDDYAHHPTEIKATLRAFRQSFPKSKIVCIFQPHTYSRTKKLFNEFARSFSDCDTAILIDIYPSLREEKDPTISSKVLIEEIKRFHKDAMYLPNTTNTVEYITHKNYGKDTVIITMGAGDVYKISDKLKVKS